MAFRPPGWAGPAMMNFCQLLDFCTTYGRREAPIIEARPPAEVAAAKTLFNHELH
jgi:hypothetical protein